MAFYYFTTESIKMIDPQEVPENFREYYADLSDEMKLEIKDIHPELFAKMEELKESLGTDSDVSGNTFSNEEQEIIEEWESISIQEWHKDTVYTDVLVCKIIPDGVRRCKIHKIDFLKKQIKYRNGDSVYSHYGYFCPECMALYIEEKHIRDIIEKLDWRGHKMLIQPVEDTLEEWDEYVEPTEISADTTIYIPDTWADVGMKCPSDGGDLIPDTYKKVYKSREVRFDACQCTKCKRILMRSAKAQQLNLECGRIGIPESDFEKIKPPVKKEFKRKNTFKPDYFIQNGEITEYDYDDQEWEELPESAILVVSYSRVCSFEDHDSEDQLVMVGVDEKRGGKKEYLLLVGYCEDCGKYYIAQEDYEIIYSAGRPNVTIYDDTSSNYYIQSGSVFEEEKKYLQKVESCLYSRIEEIENDENYISQYATGDYDEISSLSYKKALSKPLQEEINEIAAHTDKPYGYRVDLMEGKKQTVFYLGASDLVAAEERIISFNSPFGREMVNYRNLEITRGGIKYRVKRRRQFDIAREVLFGYMEQSDEDAIFREGLTDPYLVKVLNIRKKQHQLTDIMFTIQENQNAIVDAPLQKNIIVQGCAGSGKTVVMLQRLSALKYGNPDFDFGNVVILTPNENFNTHISGLASSLQLGYVKKQSVEKYYEELLLQYSSDFKLKYGISDEINVNQEYVDFLYSDEYLNYFWNAYDSVLDKLGLLHEEVDLYSGSILDERTLTKCRNEENSTLQMLAVIRELNRRIEKIAEGKELERSDVYKILIPEDTRNREKVTEFLDRIEGYTIKTIFNEVYEAAVGAADEKYYLKTGKRYPRGIRGTHRYDLYLQLQFAHKFYGYKAGKNTLICIDEGQDLCPNEYRLIRSINAKSLVFNIYGDTNQLLKTNRGINKWSSIESCIDSPVRFVLNENFRNTNQITGFCNSNFGMNVVKTGVDGHKVNEIIRNKFEETLSKLIINDERVAILLPRVVKKRDYIDLEQLPIHLRDIIGEEIGNGRISVSYVDEIKGIEFDIVFVVVNGMTKNEKYIAFTRALSELTIVYDEDIEERLKEKEQEKLKAQEKAARKEGRPGEQNKKTKARIHVNYGRVRSNKAKAAEYENTKIVYSYLCRRCKNKIELSQREVNIYETTGKKLPTICSDCTKILSEVIEVGVCKYCGKPLKMRRGKYEQLKETGSLFLCCGDCATKLRKKRAEKKLNHENEVYMKRRCIDCSKEFEITYGEKNYFESKGWFLPTRCPRCRKRNKQRWSR